MTIEKLQEDSLALLTKLISIPSFSKEEDQTAEVIAQFLQERGVPVHRKLNNVWAYNKFYDPAKPTVLLNSHHDTVKPNSGYTRDPYAPDLEDGKLYGLGSNDAGGCLVSLIATFLYFYEQDGLSYNLCLAATSEEEISGNNGLECVIPDLGPLEFGIVGEPTQMNLAIAERGLLVLDCTVTGKAGHAAREEGDNAIYKALKAIDWFRHYRFSKVSEVFGPLKMSVTIINAGSQHNVVPATCTFTVDVRVTDAYTNEEVLKIIRTNVDCEVTPRSIRLKPSSIDKGHPFVVSGIALGRTTYGSPTTSDQALLSIPSVKIGPGDSARSHMADEYVYSAEVEEGISLYIALLKPVIGGK
ncbi:M20 family metallo-hydrolase [Pedobacter antarcticus]|uniref:Acetylornithine deacetylase n=2 Tax=Pedobacter antarcticus TaxID=34086 RepID=A0A081PGI7_9SPHI|nr:M20 family metallo-hydrolase [Pedobacter antarcticus]KEQ29810.1 acetylornithine deacetylase [Pedobacter antarcticus 4BY]SDM50331.1 acetylornithine deacetylase [Pedobacter antarcticus]SFE67593.1 acetylornithine deacetylase [Pedobacter antarcticus]